MSKQEPTLKETVSLIQADVNSMKIRVDLIWNGFIYLLGLITTGVVYAIFKAIVK